MNYLLKSADMKRPSDFFTFIKNEKKTIPPFYI